MKSSRTRLGVAGLAAVSALAATATTASSGEDASRASHQPPAKGESRAAVRNVQGQLVAHVRMVALAGGRTEVRVSGAGIRPGFHGFHVHEKGACDPKATDPSGQVVPFLSAGGHFNPDPARSHAEHAGDMPPLMVTADGRARAVFHTDRFTLHQLADSDGAALIIHAGQDNLAHIPERYHSHAVDATGPDPTTRATGDAGARFACGVVRLGQ